MLETRFGLGLNFLLTWQAWRDDPARPTLLHFVATEAHPVSADDLLHAASTHPALRQLAFQLAFQWRGLLPGTHRLTFEQGRVLLTLGVVDSKGGPQGWLKAQGLCVDSVDLSDFSTQQEALYDLHMLKAVARCCRRGTQLASGVVSRSLVDGLSQVGFKVQESLSGELADHGLRAVFEPAWQPKKKRDPAWPRPRPAQRCLVIGAGLAGAAVAASLARRGWVVTVLDANATPAGGASGLPAGFLAPHVSPDDGILSCLSRSGLRATWQAVSELLDPDDGQASGVLQRRLDSSARLPADWPEAGADWSRPADETGGLAHGPNFSYDAQAPLWHAAGGWVKPARLVQALLDTPGVAWHCGQNVASLKQVKLPSTPNLEKSAQDAVTLWQALDAAGNCLAEAELVVVAAGPVSKALLAQASPSAASSPPLQAVRGQVLWGVHALNSVNPVHPERTSLSRQPREGGDPAPALALPAYPVNGLGGLIPNFPVSSGSQTQAHWLMGATFERDEARPLVRAEDTQVLIARLHQLWPSAGQALAPAIEADQAKAWAGVRCVSPDRLPLVGPLNENSAPGLWLCTAMGSRGLTFAVLCAEFLAACLHAEPLPLEKRLAQHLLASRFNQS